MLAKSKTIVRCCNYCHSDFGKHKSKQKRAARRREKANWQKYEH